MMRLYEARSTIGDHYYRIESNQIDCNKSFEDFAKSLLNKISINPGAVKIELKAARQKNMKAIMAAFLEQCEEELEYMEG